MEKILLVEPNYKNKYPPIGLMKIATYFKNKGDFVEFHKGLLSKTDVKKFNKVLITTLFTFDFDMCVQAIRYYIAIVGIENVFVGGIAATIISEKFFEEIPGLQLIRGQLTSSNLLGYTDNINVDVLELDYDILLDISYDYPSADSYFVYTTRGCPRKCPFCAVKTLEPKFYDCNNIQYQISNVDARFGIKKQLLIMDNNILYSEELAKTVNALVDIGFGIGNNKCKRNNEVKYYISSLKNRIKLGKKYDNLLNRLKKEFIYLKFNRIKAEYKEFLLEIGKKAETNDDDFVMMVLANDEHIIQFFDEYYYHKITRYIDFNQGLDARLFDDEKAELLSKLALKPCRIAFDDLKVKKEYFYAMDLAVKHGIKYFSNYLLYNYKDKPEELWERLNLNIKFCMKHRSCGVSLFSFPMKYAAIDHTDRSYVGCYWNKKYLRAMNVILNVTSGVVAKEEDFFAKAFGNNEQEFKEILTMPDEFIRYRIFFKDNGYYDLWRICYLKLSSLEREELINVLEKLVDSPEVLTKSYSKNINDILAFYSLRKKQMDANELYYHNLFEQLKKQIA